jgi:hypothetical protein
VRAVSALAVACVLGAAGCGADKAEPAGGVAEAAAAATPAATAVPVRTTPQPLAYGPGARERLAGGGIAVVDLANRVGVEPGRMDVNAEQTLNGLRWTGWGLERATGRGRVRTLVCDPTCATGRLEASSAVIVLSAPRRCGRRRFYTRASMTYERRGRTRAPDIYLRTPPC